METTNALETFAERLLKAREDKHITQQELADKLYITRQCLSRYENAEREVKISTLLDIANVLGVSTDYLLGRTGIPTNNPDMKKACEYTGLSDKAVENCGALGGSFYGRTYILPSIEYLLETIFKGQENTEINKSSLLYCLSAYLKVDLEPENSDNNEMRISKSGRIKKNTEKWNSLGDMIVLAEVSQSELIERIMLDKICQTAKNDKPKYKQKRKEKNPTNHPLL